ncbi:MAG TPA: hypothetical protein PKY05_12470 [Fibrobacteria bacterium]|nr:hypothetical protein [Fibrobacteria bacterium]
MPQEQPQEQQGVPEFSQPLLSPEEWSLQLDHLFGALKSPFENGNVKSYADSIGEAIAEHVPDQAERLRLWRMLFEIAVRIHPSIPNGNLQMRKRRWETESADRDLARSAESRADLGDLLILATNLLELAARKMDLIDGATVFSKGLNVPFSMDTSRVAKRMRELKREIEEA